MKIKKKIRDLSVEELNQYCSENGCTSCALRWLSCSSHFEAIRKHKDIFSDKFLDQKIEIEVPDILDEKEKEYLSNVIKPFRDRIISVMKLESITTPNAFYICIFVRPSVHMILGDDSIRFPLFAKDTMYKNMCPNKEYTLEELGLK